MSSSIDGWDLQKQEIASRQFYLLSTDPRFNLIIPWLRHRADVALEEFRAAQPDKLQFMQGRDSMMQHIVDHVDDAIQRETTAGVPQFQTVGVQRTISLVG